MKKERLVFGVGRNDSEQPAHEYSTIGGELRLLWVCPFYRAWSDMLVRCYNAKFQARCPTYTACTVDSGWLSFSVFRAWMLSQDHDGKHLDKDLLFPGNQVYGPDTCIFIPGQLNKFLNDRAAARGEWPIGVCWHKAAGKFSAQCRNPFTGKRGHLGLFSDPDTAHQAWRSRKHQHACAYADQQADHRIAAALRARYA